MYFLPTIFSETFAALLQRGHLTVNFSIAGFLKWAMIGLMLDRLHPEDTDAEFRDRVVA